MRRPDYTTFVLLVLILLLLGCSSTSEPVWEFQVEAYDLSEIVPPVPSNGYFSARDDYQYLLIYVNLTNIKNTPNQLAMFSGTFWFLLDEEIYNHTLYNRNVNGYLPTEYDPAQKRSGFVVFEVPLDIDVLRGRIQFRPAEGPNATKSMTFVPKKS